MKLQRPINALRSGRNAAIRRPIRLALLISVFTSCAVVAEDATTQPAPLYSLREPDVDRLLPRLRSETPSVAARATALARRNLGQPYQLFVLGEFPFETHDADPLYCLSKSDCLTHVEHIYALAMSRDFWEYLQTLQRIRYRGGQIGYATRNHFTEADWNPSNAAFFEDLTHTLGDVAPMRCRIRRNAFFGDFARPADAPGDEDYQGDFLPTERLAAALASLHDGDIVQIVRGNARQQSVTHLGLVTHHSDGTVLFLHAGKPAVREEPLLPYLRRGKDIRGVKVLRVRPDAEANMAAALAQPDFAAQFSPQRWAEYVHRVPANHQSELAIGDAAGGFRWLPVDEWAAAPDRANLASLSRERPELLLDASPHSALPFTELVASWNATTTPAAHVQFELRVADRKGDWTDWMLLGRAGDDAGVSLGAIGATSGSSDNLQPRGRVDVDVFRAPPGESYERYQIRAMLRPAPHAREAGAIVHRIAVTRSDARALRSHSLLPVSLYRMACSRANAQPSRSGAWSVDDIAPIDVPFISQSSVEPAPGGRWCSPTSVAMVLAALGSPTSPDRVAATAYDRLFDIYGNWPRNVQAAFELAGTPGYVTRIADWQTARRYLNAGIPLIISINFDFPRQLGDAPYEMTVGHLLVLRGIEGGYAIVNDPAGRDEASGRRRYSIAELEEVWMGNAGGVAYVLLPAGKSPR